MKFSASVALTAFIGTAIANPVSVEQRDVEERQLPLNLPLVDPLKNIGNIGALGGALPPIPIFGGAGGLNLPLPTAQVLPAAQALSKSILTTALSLGRGLPGSNYGLTGLDALSNLGPITSVVGSGNINAVEAQALAFAFQHGIGNFSALLNNLGPAAIPLPFPLNLIPGLSGGLTSNQILEVQKLANAVLANAKPLTQTGGLLETLGGLNGANTGGIANLEALKGLTTTLQNLLVTITDLLKAVFGIVAQITGGLTGGAGIGILG